MVDFKEKKDRGSIGLDVVDEKGGIITRFSTLEDAWEYFSYKTPSQAEAMEKAFTFFNTNNLECTVKITFCHDGERGKTELNTEEMPVEKALRAVFATIVGDGGLVDLLKP